MCTCACTCACACARIHMPACIGICIHMPACIGIGAPPPSYILTAALPLLDSTHDGTYYALLYMRGLYEELLHLDAQHKVWLQRLGDVALPQLVEGHQALEGRCDDRARASQAHLTVYASCTIHICIMHYAYMHMHMCVWLDPARRMCPGHAHVHVACACCMCMLHVHVHTAC